jgi:AcrR family transcriptional regulator
MYMKSDKEDHTLVPPKSPKEALLETAEALYAENGFDGVALRSLTQRAGTNLGSVNYYFGSKENLFREVVGRRLRPINARRLQALETALVKAGANPPKLEEVLDAFARPLFENSGDPQQSESLRRMIVRVFMAADSVLVPLFESEILPMGRQFGAAVAKARPSLLPRHVATGLFLYAGAMINMLASQKRLQALSAIIGGVPNDEEILQALVRFGVAGFDALGGASSNATSPNPLPEP